MVPPTDFKRVFELVPILKLGATAEEDGRRKFNFCLKTGGWKPNYGVTRLHLPLTVPVHDESSSVRHVRRMFHPGRGLGGPRARRTNMHFTSSSTGGLSSSSSQSSTYTPSNREAMDPIAGETPGSDGVLCRFSPH